MTKQRKKANTQRTTPTAVNSNMAKKPCLPWSHLKPITRFDCDGLGNLNLPNPPSPESNEESANVPHTPQHKLSSLLIVCLAEQLCSFIEKDVTQSQKLYEMILKQFKAMDLIDEHCTRPDLEAIRQRYRQSLIKMVSVARKVIAETGSTSLTPVARSDLDLVDAPTRGWSRYATDFEILGFINKGGFGEVFQVRNRIDGCKYAIKKIFIRSQDHEVYYQSIMNEVQLLARLHHPNIVKYYTAWLEPVFVSTQFRKSHLEILEENECSDDTDSSNLSVPQLVEANDNRLNNDENYTSDNQANHIYDTTGHSMHSSYSATQESTFMRFESESSSFCSTSISSSLITHGQQCSVEEESNSRFFREDKADYEDSSDFIEFREESQNSKISSRSLKTAVIACNSSETIANQAVLHIQMELCGRSLRQWLDWRPVEAGPRSMLGCLQLKTRLGFFWQLVSALEYLHGQNIIHHDIKPSNIFVLGNERVKLGDFGLACSYENSKSIFHKAWGTCTYAAPEQLQGGLCHYKSDIFSIGLVLLELLMPPFKTSSERIHVLQQIREHNKVPEDIHRDLPQWSALVRNLTRFHPSERPPAKDLKIKVEELLCQEPDNFLQKTLITEAPSPKVYKGKLKKAELLGIIEQLKSELKNKEHEISVLTMQFWLSILRVRRG